MQPTIDGSGVGGLQRRDESYDPLHAETSRTFTEIAKSLGRAGLEPATNGFPDCTT